jgi:hypothetical protein
VSNNPELSPRLEAGEAKANQLVRRKPGPPVLLEPADIVGADPVDAHRDKLVGAEVEQRVSRQLIE